jgi:hypothetical protein
MNVDTNMETNMDMDTDKDREIGRDTDTDKEIYERNIVDVGYWIALMIGQSKMGIIGFYSDRFFSLCRLKTPNVRCQMPSTNMYFSVFAQLCQK